MKKIIVASLAFVFLFVGTQSAFAYSPFNGQSGDCNPAVAIGIYGSIERDSQGCWTERTVYAEPGDTINIAMYYHNNTNQTLTNVRGYIVKSNSGYDDTFTFTGRMYSDQGEQTIGTVTLHVSSNEKLIYKSTHVMEGSNAVINDYDTSVVYTDGGAVNIGSVAPGWSNYGEILAVYDISSDNNDNNNNNNNDNNSCEISNFTASDTSIDDGDSTTLRWNTNNCDRVKISDIGSVNDDGSYTVYPSEDTTYVLTAYDSNGYTRTDSVRVYVDDSNNNSDNDCSIDSFTANDTSIDRGDSATLKWRTTDCNDVTISSIGSVSDDGSETVYPSYTTTYTLRAYDYNGSRTKTVRISVGNNNYYVEPNIIYNSNLVTSIATNVSQTEAQLNGLISNASYKNTDVHFEYGTTVNLGMRTNPISTNGNTNFNSYVTGLKPGTTYYFQAVSETSNGISHGAIETFKTPSYQTTPINNTNIVKKVVVQGKTIVSSSSPIMLKIENKYQTIGEGENIDYTVYYKNISSSTLTDPMVQVYIPKGITLSNISKGTYSESDRTLSVPIDDLKAGEEGTIYLQAIVDNLDSNLAQVVTTAVLVYTNPNGAQENAMAYVLNNPKTNSNSTLGAAAFLSGAFGSWGFIGLLLFIILVLVLILVARSFFNRGHFTENTH